MRVKNTSPSPRHFPYASPDPKCGRTLQPGQSSAEIPIDRIHHDQIWRDVDAGQIDITLAPEELIFLERILSAHEKSTPQKKIPKKPKPKKKPAKKAAKKPSMKPQTAKKKAAAKKSSIPSITEITVDDVSKGGVSLDQLQQANANNKGPRRVAPGQPDLGQPPGDGMSYDQVHKPKPDLEAISRHMGSRI